MFRVITAVSLSTLLAISGAAQTNPVSGTGPSTVVGCIQKDGDVYTLTDETSKTIVQLRGGILKKGRHVEIIGTQSANAGAAGSASQVIDVTSVKSLGGSCQVAGGSAKSFLSRGTVVSIGVVGGLAVVAVIATTSRLGEARGGK